MSDGMRAGGGMEHGVEALPNGEHQAENGRAGRGTVGRDVWGRDRCKMGSGVDEKRRNRQATG
jgi:hypothetical protein